VSVPAGETSREFDDRMLNCAFRQTRSWNGQEYTRYGGGNSNRFVFTTIHNAGGRVPMSATKAYRLVPGICGGRAVFRAPVPIIGMGGCSP
jgi:hypothetical protein